MKILLAVLEPWVEYCSQEFFEIFYSNIFCRNRGQFPLQNACAVSSSGCGSDRVSLFKLPSNGVLRRKREKQVLWT